MLHSKRQVIKWSTIIIILLVSDARLYLATEPDSAAAAAAYYAFTCVVSSTAWCRPNYLQHLSQDRIAAAECKLKAKFNAAQTRMHAALAVSS